MKFRGQDLDFFLYGDGFCGAVGEKFPEISRNLLALTGKIFRKKRSPNRESLVRGKQQQKKMAAAWQRRGSMMEGASRFLLEARIDLCGRDK